MLDTAFVNKFTNVLLQLPSTATFNGRNRLLTGLPPLGFLIRPENERRIDLQGIIEQLDRLGPIKSTGVRPLIVVAQNALDELGAWDTNLASTLQEILEDLNHYYAEESLLATDLKAPTHVEPEALVFKGLDERLSAMFLTQALLVGKSVTRLQVPRFIDGQSDGFVTGTSWLVASGLFITNYHVINARFEEDLQQHALETDLHLQVRGIITWFDYLREGGEYLECQGMSLVHYNRKFDYAILRLHDAHKINDRQPLQIIQHDPVLQRGKRLNIVQHANGGPLSFAMRRNFYIGPGSAPYLLHYLTDTERGASGSPVLDDNWKVLALHHSAIQVVQEYDLQIRGLRQKEIACYNNEGIAIHTILNDLPSPTRQEIILAQGWTEH